MDLTSINLFLQDPTGRIIVLLLTIWSVIWKGFALWKAARNTQRNWFIMLLVINSIGILEIIYLFYFGKKKNQQNEGRQKST